MMWNLKPRKICGLGCWAVLLFALLVISDAKPADKIPLDLVPNPPVVKASAQGKFPLHTYPPPGYWRYILDNGAPAGPNGFIPENEYLISLLPASSRTRLRQLKVDVKGVLLRPDKDIKSEAMLKMKDYVLKRLMQVAYRQPIYPIKVPLALEHIKEHNFLFVIGHHFSGTSLMKLLLELHPDVSGMQNTSFPEDEAQHFQSIYKNAAALGGIYKYGFNEESYLTEKDPSITDANRAIIFSEWSRFWKLSHSHLLEKSPRHITMTRFLQGIFGKDHTNFVVVVRHPLGCMRRLMKSKDKRDKAPDCFGKKIEHWLTLHDRFGADKPFLENLLIYQYEDLITRPNLVEEIRQVYVKLGLPDFIPPFSVVHNDDLEEGDDGEASPAAAPAPVNRDIDPDDDGGDDDGRSSRRRLLFFNGDRENLTVKTGSHMAWKSLWLQTQKEHSERSSTACKHVIQKYEKRVNAYGYSLVDLDRIVSPIPKYFPDSIFKPPEM